MKKIINLILAVILTAGITSCEKTEKSIVTKTVNISMGATYANDIFYRLSDGLTSASPRANWDIAFIVSARESAILTNGAAGVTLKAFPVTEGWAWETVIDTAGYSTWAPLNNSDTTWTEGAFNMNATVHPNYGWGEYDMITHNLTGVSLYIIKTRNGSFKKIWIENKISADQKYTFRYSDIDGSNEQTKTVLCAGLNKNFVYYSLQTDAEVDREPDSDKWDIVFTKYIDRSMNYAVTGVLHNTGVLALESTDVDPLSTSFPSINYKSSISTIGSDWKVINMDTFQYSMDETRVFFVKGLDDIVYRIKFKTFEGSSTGNLSFDLSTY